MRTFFRMKYLCRHLFFSFLIYLYIIIILLFVCNLSRRMTKPTKWPVHPAKTQISLGIYPVWSESSLCAKDTSFFHVDSEDSDQNAQADLSLLGAQVILLVLLCCSSFLSPVQLLIELRTLLQASIIFLNNVSLILTWSVFVLLILQLHQVSIFFLFMQLHYKWCYLSIAANFPLIIKHIIHYWKLTSTVFFSGYYFHCQNFNIN